VAERAARQQPAPSGEVTSTLQLPVFWVSYVVALSCAVVVLVKLYH